MFKTFQSYAKIFAKAVVTIIYQLSQNFYCLLSGGRGGTPRGGRGGRGGTPRGGGRGGMKIDTGSAGTGANKKTSFGDD